MHRCRGALRDSSTRSRARDRILKYKVSCSTRHRCRHGRMSILSDSSYQDILQTLISMYHMDRCRFNLRLHRTSIYHNPNPRVTLSSTPRRSNCPMVSPCRRPLPLSFKNSQCFSRRTMRSCQEANLSSHCNIHNSKERPTCRCLLREDQSSTIGQHLRQWIKDSIHKTRSYSSLMGTSNNQRSCSLGIPSPKAHQVHPQIHPFNQHPTLRPTPSASLALKVNLCLPSHNGKVLALFQGISQFLDKQALSALLHSPIYTHNAKAAKPAHRNLYRQIFRRRLHLVTTSRGSVC
jgi:hypothetical protein